MVVVLCSEYKHGLITPTNICTRSRTQKILSWTLRRVLSAVTLLHTMEKDILFNMQHLYPSQELINDPTDNDVLLGRGVATNRHPGNVRFRNFVGEHVVS